MRYDVDKMFEMYSLGLLHRALAYSDQDAWVGFQQCLEETVLSWLHKHPGREVACRGLCEKQVLAQVFERFRQAAVQERIAFETLARVLVYLQAILNGAILETQRTLSRPKQVSKSVLDHGDEPCMEDQIDSNEIWRILQTVLPSAREQRLAYLLYHCGLGPREILHFCPQEWSDLQEIYRLRRKIVERCCLSGL
jgi:hypothetical protein